jgi:hypothetical protein
MKAAAVILLVLMLLTAILPVGELAAPAVHPGEQVIVLLDVCHSSAPAVSPTGEMPCLSERPFVQTPLLAFDHAMQSPLQFPLFILSFYFDHPPQA